MGDVELAALQNARPGDRDVLETAGTFGNRRLSRIQGLDEPAAELGDLRKGVRFPTLVDNIHRRSFLNADHVRFEVPPRVRGSSGCQGKEIVKCSGVPKRS